MKNTKSKISQPIEDFANDVLQYAKTEATQEELTFIKTEIEEMIEDLEKGNSSK